MIKEDGKFYPMMKAVRNNSGKKTVYTEEEAWFGTAPSGKNVTRSLKSIFSERKMIRKKNTCRSFRGQNLFPQKTRLAEVKEEMELIHTALKRYESI